MEMKIIIISKRSRHQQQVDIGHPYQIKKGCPNTTQGGSGNCQNARLQKWPV